MTLTHKKELKYQSPHLQVFVTLWHPTFLAFKQQNLVKASVMPIIRQADYEYIKINIVYICTCK